MVSKSGYTKDRGTLADDQELAKQRMTGVLSDLGSIQQRNSLKIRREKNVRMLHF